MPTLAARNAVEAAHKKRNGFPKEIREIADHSLRNKDDLTSVFSTFEFGKGDRARFLIQTLGRIGDESNLEVLRSQIDDPDIGHEAMRAIRSIQLDRNSRIEKRDLADGTQAS